MTGLVQITNALKLRAKANCQARYTNTDGVLLL